MTKSLNSNHLKMIAIIAMTLDHIADLISPVVQNVYLVSILHIIGRLTAPIMFFFICEGFYYTKNLKKYITRLFVFAFVSHFAYCFAFGINYLPFATGNLFNQTSIMWSLAFAVVALYVTNKTELEKWKQVLIVILICVVTFSADWSCIAVMAILSMYSNRGNLKKQFMSMYFWITVYAVVSFLFVDRTYGIITLATALVYPLLKKYSGERGNAKWLKWFFYAYYPLHLFVIGVLRILMYGNVPLLFN